jgi:CRISPR-associated protein Cmr4
MRVEILGLLAETPLHPGTGAEEGAVDLPVAREEPFGIPFVPGSGVKGAMREKFWQRTYDDARAGGAADDAAQAAARRAADKHYGATDQAGPLAISDARLLLLPVRSLGRIYRWVTCPYILERLARDHERAKGAAAALPGRSELPQSDNKNEILLNAAEERCFLEEFDFAGRGDPDKIARIVAIIEPLIACSEARERLPGQLAVVSDSMFEHFARHALPVAAHNVLDARKVSTNLFYEETLPTDSLLYALVAGRGADALQHLDEVLPVNDGPPYLRVGGNETLGQGWCRVARPWREGAQP